MAEMSVFDYFIGSLLDELLIPFFPKYHIIGHIAKSAHSNMLSISEDFYGITRIHAKKRFMRYNSFIHFDRIIAINTRRRPNL